MRCAFPCFILLLVSGTAQAGPGDVIYEEDFQDGTAGGWSQIAGGGTLGVGEYAPGSGEFALTTCCGVTDVVSPAIDTSVPGAQLSLRVQRGGAGIGSDVPDGTNDSESLDLFFLASNGSWQFATRYPANGPAAQVLVNSHVLAPQFLHANFRVRLRQRGGNAGADFWHLHEIHVTEAAGSGGLGRLCDDFEQGPGNWTVNGNGGQAAITTQTANSATRSLALFDGPVRVESFPLDLANAAAATLNAWIRRGDDAFSEAPDAGQNLVVGYIDGNGVFQQLADLAGAGTPGEIFDVSVTLPANALHAGFRVQFNRLGGGGGYWHVDDVCIDIVRSLDHFALLHDGEGVNCQAEPVEIVAHDADHFVVENHGGSIALSTSTARGDWSLLSGNGVLANGGNGGGNYGFASADGGRVLLGLRDTFVESLDIDVAGNGSTESAGEDTPLAFRATGFNFLVNGAPAPLPVQIAGKPSDVAPGNALIELQAIRTDTASGACSAVFSGNVNIELAFSCEDPQQCHGIAMEVNGMAVAANAAGAPAAFTPVPLDFGDAGDTTATLRLRYLDSGSVQLHARHLLQPSGAVMSGASAPFVVRPFGWHIEAAGNPAATDANGPVYRKAGDDFSVTASAVAWQADDDVDHDGVPDGHGNDDPMDNVTLADNPVLPGFGQETSPDSVPLGASLWQPAGGNHPALGGNAVLGAFFDGSSGTTLRHAEAGIIELAATLGDADYLGTGAIASRSAAVGRFTPHHFDLGVLAHGCNDDDGMSYSGQPLQRVSLMARNASGGTVQNYDGASGFAKTVTITETTGAAGSVLNGGIANLDFASGEAFIEPAAAGIAFRFSGKETAPAAIRLRATDSDGVSSQGFAEGGTLLRSARLALADANAAVLTAARVWLQAESYDGGDWQPETRDNCTSLDVAGFALANHAGNLDAGETLLDAAATIFSSGSGSTMLTAPGNGNAGSVELHYDAPDWLEFDWLGDGERNPFASVRFFAPFRTESRFIMRQEVVR